MEFRILGPLEVVGDLGAINLGGPQQRRVAAAMLADPGHVLTYDRLQEVLWPAGEEPPNARRTAISYVSRLRAALGDGIVTTTDAGYVLDLHTCTVDADRFTALSEQARLLPGPRAVNMLDEALALWRGPVFGDLTHEWWALPLVTRLEELRLTTMAERIDALSADGWNSRAVADVLALVDAHPLREQFVDRAMRGLHATGRTPDALRTYQRFRTDLAEQTGLDPSAALVDLERSIAQGAVLPQDAAVGHPLRGYVLHELIGEGSFGAVHRAVQPGVERDVAIKVIRPELADDRSFVHRFEAEAQLVARLEHPHIVPLYDFWRQPGGAFLVFRLLRGGTAVDLMRRDGPLDMERATAVLVEIGSALTAAHGAGVVHRDVKPANVLFDEAGSAYLGDFGIAAGFADDPSMPARWSAGSALYAAPEQLRDDIDDPAADQYALAATIWELVTGTAPFGGDRNDGLDSTGNDTSSIIARKLRAPLGAACDVRSSVPVAVSKVMQRAGSVHPADRYPTVAEFVAAWQQAVIGSAARATDPHTADSRGDATAMVHAATLDAAGRSVINPYKGLRPFRESDAADFFGRGELVDTLVKTVEEARFVAVVGPSGSGKSSLVLAGLVPRLRAAGELVVTMTPGDDPFESVAAGLQQIARADQAGLLTQPALRRADGLLRAFASLAASDPVVLVIDQLEELWTLVDPAQRGRFLTSLDAALRGGVARMVGTVRADFFDRPLSDPVLGAMFAANTFGITPMTAAEVHTAITAPAEQIGVRFEPALVSRIAADATDQPGTLPLLQFTLAELFERRSGAVVGMDAYDALGGLTGSLGRQADEILDSFGPDDQAATRRLFSRLVTPGEGDEDTRRRVLNRDLAGVPDRVIAAFVDRRLLTTDRDRRSREPTVEVAHEVLLRSWQRLRGWLNEDRSWLRELRGLSTATNSWSSGGSDDADLYRGARLAVVSDMAAERLDALTTVEQQFLTASQALADADEREMQQRVEEQARQNRRLRRSLIGVGVALVVAVVAGSLAVVQRGRADRAQQTAVEQRNVADAQRADADIQRTEAEDQRSAAQAAATLAQDNQTKASLAGLASRSLSARSTTRDLAALLAVEAWKRSPDAASKSALFGTFTFDPGFFGFLDIPDSGSVNGRVIPGTTRVIVASYGTSGERRIRATRPRIVDVMSGEEIAQLEPLLPAPPGADVEAGVLDSSIVVSRNGKFAVWGGGSQDLDLFLFAAPFDAATGAKLGPTIELTPQHHQLAISDDGRFIAATTDLDGRVEVYDAATGTLVSQIPGVVGAPTSPRSDEFTAALAFTPDGQLYVGSLADRLRLFDPATARLVTEYVVPPISTASELLFSEDGTTMVARGLFYAPDGQLGSVARIDLPSGTIRWQISGPDYGFGECFSAAFDLATDRLWCGNYFGLIRVRSLRTGQRTGQALQSQKGWTYRLGLVDYAGSPVLVGFSQNSGSIGRWGVGGNGPIQRVVARDHVLLSVSSDGRVGLVGAPNGGPFPFGLAYSLWDFAADRELPGLPQFLYAFAKSDVVVGVFADGTVGTFDTRTQRRTSFAFSLDPLPTTVNASEDASVLLVGYADGRAVMVDSRFGTVIRTFQIPAEATFQPSVDGLTLSPDHSRLFVSSYGTYVFDAATGETLAQSPDYQLFIKLVTSNGEVLAARVDGRLGIVDPTTLAITTSLPGTRGSFSTLSASADGRTVIGRSADDTISLYDIESRSRLGDSIGADYSPDPALVDYVTVDLSDDATVAAMSGVGGPNTALWDLDASHWVDAACALAGRNLTREEWATYLQDLGKYRSTCPQFAEDR